MKSKITLTLFALLALGTSARSQSYSIDWSSLNGGGGGTSVGGPFSLSGTIGQPDAGPSSVTGGNYSLTGGFWSLFAVQTTGAPRLTIAFNAQRTMATVSWPSPSTGFVLEQNSDLNTPNWVTVPASAVSDNGTVKSTIATSSVGVRYYRLMKPR
jgi:hypothetical protein